MRRGYFFLELLTIRTMLQLARPLRFDYPESQAFMERKLAESGLVPEDLNAYPIAPIGMSKVPGFLIPYNDREHVPDQV